MIRTKKVERMLRENGIQGQNYTLIVRLKTKIQQLKTIISNQQQIITQYKKDIKSTRMNQMEVEIQHLNDQNKRLILVVEDFRSRVKAPIKEIHNKKVPSATVKDQKNSTTNNFKVDTKMADVLKENQALKKQLMNFKIGEQAFKKRDSTLNDRSNIALTKNLIEIQKIMQAKLDLQAQNNLMNGKIVILQHKINDIQKKNEEMQNQLRRTPNIRGTGKDI